MKTIDVIQRTPEWQRWRAQGVTASEAAVVVGRSPLYLADVGASYPRTGAGEHVIALGP